MEEHKYEHTIHEPGDGDSCEHEQHHHHAHAGSDSCGHEHHHHEHSGNCSCGHEHHHHAHAGSDPCEHEHHHEHDGNCSCGHEHHSPNDQTASHVSTAKSLCTVYLLKNIDCANCSAKIEAKIRELPEVDDAILTFATRQLRVYADAGVSLLPRMQEIADLIEPGTVIEARKGGRNKAEEKEKPNKHSRDLPEILGGAALFIVGNLLAESMSGISAVLFIAAYLILGRGVLMTAWKNLRSGHVMDENFLMSLATLGAFAINQFAEAVGVMLFYRAGEAFEHRAVEKSRSQIMDAVDLRPETVLLDTGAGIREIPADDAAVGQIIEVRPGDRIPLDSMVIEGESRIDTSPVTGEPVPVAVRPGETVLSGCVNTSGLLKLRVEKELSESMVTRILNSVENAAASKPRAERFITKFARIYTPVVVALAAATAVLPSLVTGNWSYWIYTALTFLVISCPCALVLSVPLAFFSGIGSGSKKGILFKGGIVLEALKDIKTVVMDKTGTITRGCFEVQTINPAKEFSTDELLSMAASCESASTHPIASSIRTAAESRGIAYERPDSITELPGRGIRALMGHSELLCGSKKLMEENGIGCSPFREDTASTVVLLAKDGVFAGSVSIADTIKPEAAGAIASLKNLGIRTAMLTGDNEATAAAVAGETGIDLVHARLLPGEKLDTLQKLRGEHGNAMFVGDGINDAPVLAGADVGAAMGSGADAAIEAADVVFMTSSMEAIPTAIRIARQTGAVAMQNVIFALVIKILVMLLGLAGHASMWMAVFADTGVAMLCVLNSIRILYKK